MERNGGKNELKYTTKTIISGKHIQVYQYSTPIKIGFQSKRLDYSKSDKTVKSDKSLYRTRNQIKNIIDSNTTQYSKFITFTYAKNMQDREKCINDFHNFKRRYKKHYKKAIKYIAVLEQQKRGAYHIHMILFEDQKLSYIDLKRLWKQGSVDLKKIDSSDNLGLYLMKYITKDMISINNKSFFKSPNLKKPFQEYKPLETDLPLKLTYTKQWNYPIYNTHSHNKESFVISLGSCSLYEFNIQQ